MSQNAFDVGAPIPTVNAAVEARLISALKTERVAASRVLTGPIAGRFSGDRDDLVEPRQALYASKITSYAQGMALLRLASAEYGYDIDPGDVASIWRAGCIIRAALLCDIRAAFRRDTRPGQLDARCGVQRRPRPAPASAGATSCRRRLASAFRAGHERVARLLRRLSSRAPARQLTQAQRDFFGAHTYRRVDRDGVFHTQWADA